MFQHLLPAGPGVVLFWKGQTQRRPSTQFQKPTLGSDLLENIPTGAEAEVISVQLQSCDTLGQSLYLVLFLSNSLSPVLLWFSEVYLLLTHPVSSQPVLCHRTHGTTQQGSDSCLTASSPCTGRGRVRRCRFKRVVRAQEHKLYFYSVPFYANETLNCILHTTSPSKHHNEGWMKIPNSYSQIYRSPFSTF